LILRNEREVQNTRRKLERLEALLRARQHERGGDEVLRDMTMESLAGTIKQFKEEIARYECGLRPDNGAERGGNGSRQLENDIELASTREKLRSLEEAYKRDAAEPTNDPAINAVSKRSLKRLINQLKEDIARYEAHELSRR